MDAARGHRGGKMMRARDHVADNLCIRGRWHIGLKEADDGGGTIANAAEANCFAYHIRIFFEHGGPETICRHDDPSRVGTVVLRSNDVAECIPTRSYWARAARRHPRTVFLFPSFEGCLAYHRSMMPRLAPIATAWVRSFASSYRHLQVHQRDVGMVLAKLFERLPSIAGFRNHLHVGLIPD